MGKPSGRVSSASDPARQRDALLGLALVLASAVAWSTMGLFVRMVPDADVWSVVFWRCIFGGPSIVALAMLERKRLSFDWQRTLTPAGIAITCLIAGGIVCAIYSMQHTTIANGAVIYSTVPFVAALLAWVWFRELPGRRTTLCTIVAIAGVAVTVSGTIALGGSGLDGDFAMVGVTFSIAMMTVIMRRYRDTPMLESVALACFVAAGFSYWFTDPFALPGRDILLLGLFGVVTQGAGLGIYTMGARRLPAAQAALLSSAEMPMSPLWVWIFFNETPAPETFIGGALVLAALVWNILAEIRANRATAPALASAGDSAGKDARETAQAR